MPENNTTVLGNIPNELPAGTTPILQPGGIDSKEGFHRFSSQEIPHWKNGKWGDAGYAIPNNGGKLATGNMALWRIYDFIGAELFNLIHQDDMKLSRPPNGYWLKAFSKMVDLGVKRLNDRSISWGKKRTGDSDKGGNAPKQFMIYPVPYFGGRVRQKDMLEWTTTILKLLGEIAQHADNVFDSDVTDFVTSMIQEKLIRVRDDMAMKYLGMKEEELATPEGKYIPVPVGKFAEGVYDPSSNFTSRELVEENAPLLTYPSANDLSAIAGIPASVAYPFAVRWAGSMFFGDGGSHETSFPNDGTGEDVIDTVTNPGS